MLKTFRADLATGLQLLTRLPTGWLHIASPASISRSSWLWPIIGAGLGILQWGVFHFFYKMGFALSLCILISMAISILVTGGLHEDGLADTADGFGGGKNREDTLRIMHDSRIGSYGTMALVLVFSIRYAGLYQLAENHTLLATLIITGCFSRLSMVWLLSTLPSAQNTGLAHFSGQPSSYTFKKSLAVTFIIGLLTLPFFQLMLGSLVCYVFLRYLKKLTLCRIGGISGDVLGFACCLIEAGLLVIFSKTLHYHLPYLPEHYHYLLWM